MLSVKFYTFICFHVTDWHPFIPTWIIPFSSSLKRFQGWWTPSAFCLSGKMFISPLILRDSFVRYSILSHFKKLLAHWTYHQDCVMNHSSWHTSFCEKSLHIWVFLCMWWGAFVFVPFRVLSLTFEEFVIMCLGVTFWVDPVWEPQNFIYQDDEDVLMPLNTRWFSAIISLNKLSVLLLDIS